MKTTLSLIALFSLAGVIAAAAVEFTGIAIPTYLTAETGIGLFSAAFVLLAFVSEYSRRPTIDRVRVRKPVVTAAVTVPHASHGLRLVRSRRRTARHALAA
jgi:hypothetical protein